MGNVKRYVTGQKSDAVRRLSIFGPPPLLGGEDSKAYDELLAQVSSAMKPSDVFGEIFANDFAYFTWEIRQLRGAKKALIADAVEEEAQFSAEETMDEIISRAILEKIEDIERIDPLLDMCVSRRNASLREMDRHNASLAQALRDKARDIEDAEFETIEAKVIASKNAA